MAITGFMRPQLFTSEQPWPYLNVIGLRERWPTLAQFDGWKKQKARTGYRAFLFGAARR